MVARNSGVAVFIGGSSVNNMFSKAAVWLVIALVLFTVFKQFDTRQGRGGDTSFFFWKILKLRKKDDLKHSAVRK